MNKYLRFDNLHDFELCFQKSTAYIKAQEKRLETGMGSRLAGSEKLSDIRMDRRSGGNK
jgi:hypothetical protein